MFRVWDNDMWRSIPVAGREALMATKDKSSGNTKKVAGKSLEEKRLEKRTKRFAAESMAELSEDRRF
jgi:hypothetical protein